jgi:uncharacterized protein
MVLRILVIAALLLMCACQQSPRKEYFALSSPITAAANSSSPSNLSNTSPSSSNITQTQTIGIGPISIPEYLQHSRISYWKTPNQLLLQENHYWVEPLEQGVSRVLGLQLQSAHPHWRFVQFPWRNNQRPDYAIRADIQRLDAFSDHAIIAVRIDLVDMKTKLVMRSQHFSAQVACAGHSAAIAQAFSELLQQTAASMDLLLTQEK